MKWAKPRAYPSTRKRPTGHKPTTKTTAKPYTARRRPLAPASPSKQRTGTSSRRGLVEPATEPDTRELQSGTRAQLERQPRATVTLGSVLARQLLSATLMEKTLPPFRTLLRLPPDTPTGPPKPLLRRPQTLTRSRRPYRSYRLNETRGVGRPPLQASIKRRLQATKPELLPTEFPARGAPTVLDPTRTVTPRRSRVLSVRPADGDDQSLAGMPGTRTSLENPYQATRTSEAAA